MQIQQTSLFTYYSKVKKKYYNNERIDEDDFID